MAASSKGETRVIILLVAGLAVWGGFVIFSNFGPGETGNTELAVAAPDEGTVEQGATDPAGADGETMGGMPDAGDGDNGELQAATIVEPETANGVLSSSAPSFDVVRVDPDGGTLIAGLAEPGTDVAVEVDGAEVTRTRSDSNGSFAALFDVALSDQARVVELVSYGPDGTEIRSVDTVILAPSQSSGGGTVGIVAADSVGSLPQTEEAPAAPDVARLSVAEETSTPLGGSADTAQTPAQTTADGVIDGSASAETAQARTDADGAITGEVASDETAVLDPSGAAGIAASEQGATEVLATVGESPETLSDAQGALAETAQIAASAAGLDVAKTEPVAPAVLLSGAEGVSVLQPLASGPDGTTAEGVVVDSIGYTTTGDVRLSGR
ncbi:MAG: hypothetical protein AAFY60_10030, partial [Myxococcota bacterium]